ncbi:serine/threonine protein phosphatase PP1 isozyme, putative, partial [Entamoeba invadens IP1]
IVAKLLQDRNLFPPRKEIITDDEIMMLCDTTTRVLSRDPSLLQLKAPLNIIGDLHGQYSDLLRYFDEADINNEKFLFLGDFVDRGPRSIDIVVLIFCLKIKFPDRFFLLRGNHEVGNINRDYGFYDECVQRFNVDVWRKFCWVFGYLPVAALIDSSILCVHGGISKYLSDVSLLTQVARPTDVAEEGLLCDLLWADPSQEHMGWKENTRGASFTYGEDVVENFMTKNNIQLICRGHQVVEEGFEFAFNNKVLTLFSAPNYCNQFNNCGAMMKVSKNLACNFVVLQPKN